MLATTVTSHMVDEDMLVSEAWVRPSGDPHSVTKLTFDPQGDKWLGNLHGIWPVKKLRIRKARTVWERLR